MKKQPRYQLYVKFYHKDIATMHKDNDLNKLIEIAKRHRPLTNSDYLIKNKIGEVVWEGKQ